MMCVTKVSLNYSLFAAKFSHASSEVYADAELSCFFFSCIFPKRGLRGTHGALEDTTALLPYYVKILHAARLADDERDEFLFSRGSIGFESVIMFDRAVF